MQVVFWGGGGGRVRRVAGQAAAGVWGHSCPSPPNLSMIQTNSYDNLQAEYFNRVHAHIG